MVEGVWIKPARTAIVLSVLLGSILVAAVAGLAYLGSRRGMSELVVDQFSIRWEEVKRGDMVRQVHGLGPLVPEELFHVPAPHPGRVVRIPNLAGTRIPAQAVLVELSNPEMQQLALDAEWNLRTAEADLASLGAQIHSQLVSQRSDLAALQAQHRDAKAKNERDALLYGQGLMLELDFRLSTTAVEDLATRIRFQQEKGEALEQSLVSQQAAKEASVRQLRAALALRRQQLNELTIRAGVAGTLEQLLVQVGQQVTAGADLAVVVQPRQLKAALSVAETQAKELAVGQKARIETGDGSVTGHVSRIEPAVVNGTRTVDVKFDAPLPAGAVPDKTVDGTIEVERLSNVLYIPRPSGSRPGTRITVFKVSPDGRNVQRAGVVFGRASANAIEVLEGLVAGDRVVISDTSVFEGRDRIRLR